MKNPTNPIYTIGYQGIGSVDDLIQILKSQGINTVIDVRFNGFDRKFPEFSRVNLIKSLGNAKINYMFLGTYLGGVSNDASLFTNNVLDYVKVRLSDKYQSKLKLVTDLVDSGKSVCLLDFKANPIDDHRLVLISGGLMQNQYQVNHIEVNGSDHIVNEHQHYDKLMRKMYKLTDKEPTRLAYAYRNYEIGYKKTFRSK